MTSLSDSVPTTACACGSGLSADRCCGMNTGTPPAAATVPGGEPESEALLARRVRLDPNDLGATQALALALFNRGALAEAEPLARNAVRIAPTDVQSHNLMGMILTEAQRPQVGEHHYRRALELLARPDPILLANLAWNLKNQGRMAEARAFYEQSKALDPGIFQTVFGWAKMEETDRNFARAAELLDDAERLAPGAPSVRLARAVLHGRTREYERAVAILDDLERERGGGLGPLEWSEKGLLLDKMGRHADAFVAFTEAKRSLRELTGQAYMAEEAAALVRRLAGFFTAPRLSILPKASVREGAPQPVFIVGFPRSGTTMVEQTLSAHPKIAAGDELPIIGELSGLIPRMLSSPLAYPEALADLWLGDQLEGLDNLRDYYLQRARQLGATPKGAAWFTDKMPLNETHLGLIHLIFPQAPIIHLLRHPLDVVLSVFSNHLTHGFYCAYDLASIARHYVLIMELVEHYRREMPLNYLAIRYEDIVADQEASVKQMLGFIGAPFDRRCLAFHENRRYARTASYAQVTEKLYDRSRYRYRAYRRELEPVIPILEPTIRRLGYAID
jgi:Flp pilus assembly protein TadD